MWRDHGVAVVLCACNWWCVGGACGVVLAVRLRRLGACGISKEGSPAQSANTGSRNTLTRERPVSNMIGTNFLLKRLSLRCRLRLIDHQSHAARASASYATDAARLHLPEKNRSDPCVSSPPCWASCKALHNMKTIHYKAPCKAPNMTLI